MTAVEQRLSLLQEVATILDDEKLVKKALTSIRRLKKSISDKRDTPDTDHAPTKEERIEDLKEAFRALKARQEGKDTTGMFRDARELLNEI